MAKSVDHIQYKESIVNESFDLLLQQFKGSPNIVGLLTIIAQQKQILDDAIIGVGKLRIINTATGVYLDNIGEELGVPRNGASDEDYRVILKIRSYRTRTSGTRPQIVDLLARFTGTNENSINTYVGIRKTFDVAFYEGCLNIEAALAELLKVFPIISSYRLVQKAGTPFGFTSTIADYDPPFLGGFGSVFLVSNDDKTGHFGGMIDFIE